MKKINLTELIAPIVFALLFLFNPAQTKAQDDIIDKSTDTTLEDGACGSGNYEINFTFPYYPANSVHYVDINNISCYSRLQVGPEDKKYEFCAAYNDGLCFEGSDHNPGIIEITFRDQSGNSTSVKKISFDIADPSGTDYTVIAYNSGTTTISKSGYFAFSFENCTDPFTKIEIQCTLNTNVHPDYNNLFELNNLVIYYEPTITLGANPAVCRGATSASLTYSATTGSPDQYSINYDVAAKAAGFIDVGSSSLGASPVQLVIPASASAGTYNATLTIQNASGCSRDYPIKITIDPSSAGGNVTGGTHVCSGTNNTVLTLTGYTGSVVRWQYSNDYWTSSNDIANTTASYTAANLTTTTQYRAVVKSGVCTEETSTAATITVDPATVGGGVTGGTHVCSGTNNTVLTLTGYTGSVVRWQYSTDNWTSSNDIGNTTASYTAANLTTTTQYRAVVKSGVCTEETSTAATITVEDCPPEVVCVMDLSGSMESDFYGYYNKPYNEWRIAYAKVALEAFTQAAYSAGNPQYGLASFKKPAGADCIGYVNYDMDELDDSHYNNYILPVINNFDTDGMTPLLAGLETAKNMFQTIDANDKKAIVLLSDGAQNCPYLSGYSDPYYTTILNQVKDRNIKVYTIGFGKGGEVDLFLLNNIATQTNGKFYDVTDDEDVKIALEPGPAHPADEPWEAGNALHNVYFDVLHGCLDLSYIEDPMGVIEKGTTRSFNIQVSQFDSRAIFFISWVNGKPENIKVKIRNSQGTELPPNHPGISYIHQDKYTLITVSGSYLNLPGVVGSTPWQLELNADEIVGNSEKFEYLVLSKSGDLSFHIWPNKEWYYTGDIIKVYLELMYEGNPVTGLNDTRIAGSKPLIGIGNLLAAKKYSSNQLDNFSKTELGQLILQTRVEAKKQGLDSIQTQNLVSKNVNIYKNERSSYNMLKTRMIFLDQKIDLNKRVKINGMEFKDDGTGGDEIAGDGIFTAEYNKLRQEGSYKFNVGVSGSVNGKQVSRQGQLNAFVRVNTLLRYYVKHISMIDTAMSGRKAYNIRLNLKDKYGNLPHPFSLKNIDLELDKGELVGPLMANPDGSFTQKIFLDENIKPKNVTLSMNIDNRQGEDYLKNRFFLCYWICRKFCKGK
jgi:ribosomal protein S11